MTKLVMIRINEQDEEQLEFLKKFSNSKTRTKTFKFCLKKTFDMYSDIKH